MQSVKTTSIGEVDHRLPPGFCTTNKQTKQYERIQKSSTNLRQSNRLYKTSSKEETNLRSVKDTENSLPPHLPRRSSSTSKITAPGEDFVKEMKMKNSSPRKFTRNQTVCNTNCRTAPTDRRLKEDTSRISRSNSKNKQSTLPRSQVEDSGVETGMNSKKQHSVSDSPMEIDGMRSLAKQESSTKGTLDILRLRLFLAEKMSKAVECSPQGGVGIPVDRFLQEFQELIGRSAISALTRNTTFEKLLASECSDLATVQALKVDEEILNGCVPSTEFCQNAKRIEKEIREIVTTAQKTPETVETTSVETQQKEVNDEVEICQKQECSQKEKLICMIKELLQKTLKDILSKSRTFPSVQDFEKLFEEEYNQKLNPEIAGYQTVQGLLKGCHTDDLVSLVHANDTVFLIPTNQVFIAHQEEQREKEKVTEELQQKTTESRDAESEMPTSSAPDPATMESELTVGELAAVVKSDAAGEELEKKVKVPEMTDKNVSVVDLSADGEVYGGMREVDFERFDVEIVDKLRELFVNVVCKDGHHILLNRLPMYFLKFTGTVLNYDKYGFINLADVVALLEDIVQVVETEKGKMIIPVKRTIRRRTGQRLVAGGESTQAVRTNVSGVAVVETQPTLTGSMAVEYGRTAYSPQLSPRGDQLCWNVPSTAMAGWGVNIQNPAIAQRTPIAHPVLVPGGGVRSASLHDPTFYRTSLPRAYQQPISAPFTALQQNIFHNPYSATGKRF